MPSFRSEGARLECGVKIRWELKPGDMGAVLKLHGLLYAREHGFDCTFEGYVAQGLAEFALALDTWRDRLWIAEAGGEVIGSIAILHREGGEAQLRWFLVAPEARGRGLGRELLQGAVAFSRERGYERIFLWTLKHLAAACHLYTSAGFVRAAEKTHLLWGREITEERYDLLLPA